MAPVDVRTDLTQERLMPLLNYEQDTGFFTWKVDRPHIKIGDRAGYLHKKSGYRKIKIDGHSYSEARLAWLYMTGAWPKNLIDHIDVDRANNSWLNLRQATNTQNQHNRTAQKTKIMPLKGVFLKRDVNRSKRWFSAIRIDGKLKHLGYFHRPEEAHAAYKKASEQAFGQYARS